MITTRKKTRAKQEQRKKNEPECDNHVALNAFYVPLFIWEVGCVKGIMIGVWKPLRIGQSQANKFDFLNQILTLNSPTILTMLCIDSAFGETQKL